MSTRCLNCGHSDTRIGGICNYTASDGNYCSCRCVTTDDQRTNTKAHEDAEFEKALDAIKRGHTIAAWYDLPTIVRELDHQRREACAELDIAREMIKQLTEQRNTASAEVHRLNPLLDTARATLRRIEELVADESKHLVRWIDDSHLIDLEDLTAILEDNA